MSGPLADALFEALANGLSRGSLLVLAVALVLRLFKRTTAAERYAVWLAILTVIALAPLAEVALHSMQSAEPAPALAVTETTPTAADWTLPESAGELSPRWRGVEVAAAPFLVLWMAMGVLLAMRLWRRCSLAASLKRRSTTPERELALAVEGWQRDLDARRIGITRISHSLRSPAAVGWLRPAVLLPDSAEMDVRGGDLEMLWRHEQAHVSRGDDWTQLLSECLFALAWFHPAAYWVRRHLEKERELACDEAVLDAGVAAHRYAGALGRWAERAATGELPAGVMGLGRSRALIIRRIEMLLSPSRILRRNGGRLAFGAGLAAALIVSLLLSVSGLEVVRAQSAAEPVAVDVEVELQRVVGVAIPDVPVVPAVTVEPVVPDVQVTPVLVGQAVPQAPAPIGAPGPRPAPVAALAPLPQAVPAPPAPPTPPVPPAPPVKRDQAALDRAKAMADQARRWRDEMRPEIEEIQREAERLQEYVRETVRPQQERIQEAARKLAEEHRTSLEPLAKEMAELGAKMGEAFSSAQRKALQERMEAVARRMEEKRPEFQRLEEEMSRIQIDMKPFEERMKALGDELQKKHEELEKARREFEESNQ